MQSSSLNFRPKILVLGTGGTIAGVSTTCPTEAGYRAGVLDIAQLVEAAPGIERLADLQAEQLASIDSKDMRPAVWQKLASRIAQWFSQPDAAGCVITHGSDTLEETAYFLQCVLPVGKPVVLTAAMRPATALSADGPRNLYDAVQVAASLQAVGRGVLCALHGHIHAACDVTKSHPEALVAFSSGSRGPLGFVGTQGVQFTRNSPDAGMDTLPAPSIGIWPWVELVSSHAGANGGVVRALLRASQHGGLEPRISGLVVLGTGHGTVHEDLQQALDEAVSEGVRVIYASRAGVAQGGPYDGLNAVKVRVRLMLELARPITR